MAFANLFTGVAAVFPASFFWPYPKVRTGMALAGTIVYELPIIVMTMHCFDHVSPRRNMVDGGRRYRPVAVGAPLVAS
jgi:hypothetical protein